MKSLATTIHDDLAGARLERALSAEGFGVLSDIDLRATLEAKLDADHEPLDVLGVRNPLLARRARDARRRLEAALEAAAGVGAAS